VATPPRGLPIIGIRFAPVGQPVAVIGARFASNRLKLAFLAPLISCIRFGLALIRIRFARVRLRLTLIGDRLTLVSLPLALRLPLLRFRLWCGDAARCSVGRVWRVCHVVSLLKASLADAQPARRGLCSNPRRCGRQIAQALS
jgi:hypothetical protein